MLSFLIWLGMGLFFVLGYYYSRRNVRLGKAPGLFFHFWHHLARSFTGPWLVLHLVAVGATVLMVTTRADLHIQLGFQRVDPLGYVFPWILLAFGNVWHALAGLVIILRARITKSVRLMGAGLAGLQALLIDAFVVMGEKVLSGRRGPLRMIGDVVYNAPFIKTKDPMDFRFDFWNHAFVDGRFFWPSGHTSSVFAFVSALVAYYPEKRWIPWIGYPLSLMMGWAMIDGDFHWASDVVAGAFIGHAIGWVVGRSFRDKYKKDR